MGVMGAAGYTGGELIRLLLLHPQVELASLHSRSHAGEPISKVHADLLGDSNLFFTDATDFLNSGRTDVLFLCLGHGESKEFLRQHPVHEKTRIIDLTTDHRLRSSSSVPPRKFIYGLPELNRDRILTADAVANPGCFATTLQLGLLPLAATGLLKDVHATGITGSTGAGQALSATNHFSWRENNIQAYKTLTHQHLEEIYESLSQAQPDYASKVHFIPWRGNFTRGIFVSSQTPLSLSLQECTELYEKYYAGHPFTHISKEPIYLKQVINTNKCLIQLEKVGDQLVIHSITDNLVKGASGQAVQNMNLMMGLEESTGLRLKATAF